MKIKIKPYRALPCALETFTINGIHADLNEFGSMNDEGSEYAGNYACRDMRFTKYDEPLEGLLKKYNITREEYDEICEELDRELCVGSCGWCI